MQNEEALINIEQARQTVRAEQQLRVRAFLQELQASATRHRCQVFAVPRFTTDGRTVAMIQVSAGSFTATMLPISMEEE